MPLRRGIRRDCRRDRQLQPCRCGWRMPEIHARCRGHEADSMRLGCARPERSAIGRLLRSGEAIGAESEMHVRRDAVQHCEELRREA